MITAIVLIKAEPQKIAQAATRLAGIEGISQVYSVSGEWDLVAMLEVAEHEAIARIVTEQVTVVPGIRSTHTLTAFRAYSKKELGTDIAQLALPSYGAAPLLTEETRSGRLDAVLNFWTYAARLQGDNYRALIEMDDVLIT